MDKKKYKGNKGIDGVYHKIINSIPSCNVFVELFAGAAEVSKKLTVPPGKIILVELCLEQSLNLEKENSSCAVVNDCALNFLSQKSFQERTVIFVDPPYMWDTRPNSLKLYNHEQDDIFHYQLVQLLLNSSCFIIVIHPVNDFYKRKFENWYFQEVKIRYNRKTSIEGIWTNFDTNTELQDVSLLGKDCWERQRINRKLNNLVSKINNLSINERKKFNLLLNK